MVARWLREDKIALVSACEVARHWHNTCRLLLFETVEVYYFQPTVPHAIHIDGVKDYERFLADPVANIVQNVILHVHLPETLSTAMPNLRGLECYAQNLLHMPTFGLTSLTTLRLRRCAFGSLNELLRVIDDLPKLRSLDLIGVSAHVASDDLTTARGHVVANCAVTIDIPIITDYDPPSVHRSNIHTWILSNAAHIREVNIRAEIRGAMDVSSLKYCSEVIGNARLDTITVNLHPSALARELVPSFEVTTHRSAGLEWQNPVSMPELVETLCGFKRVGLLELHARQTMALSTNRCMFIRSLLNAVETKITHWKKVGTEVSVELAIAIIESSCTTNVSPWPQFHDMLLSAPKSLTVTVIYSFRSLVQYTVDIDSPKMVELLDDIRRNRASHRTARLVQIYWRKTSGYVALEILPQTVETA